MNKENIKKLLRKRICIIHNPTAGGSNKLYGACLEKLKEFKIQFEVLKTTAPGHAKILAKEAEQDPSFEAIIIAGGDGSINEAANGILATTKPFGIIPIGTANVLAHEIGLKLNSTSIANAIAFGEAKPIYLGNLNGNVFLLMASVGFDSRVVAQVSTKLKKIVGKGAYLISAVKVLLQYSSPKLIISTKEKRYKGNWVIISKSSCYGGKFRLAPEADLKRPDFIVTVFKGEKRKHIFLNICSIILGQVKRCPETQVFSTQELTIEGEAIEPFQVDGDHSGYLPLDFQLSKKTVNLIYPEEAS